jgi:hypothetical protein
MVEDNSGPLRNSPSLAHDISKHIESICIVSKTGYYLFVAFYWLQGSTTAGERLTKIGGAACLSNNL